MRFSLAILEILPLCLDPEEEQPGTRFCLLTGGLSFSSCAENVRIYCFTVGWNRGLWGAGAVGGAPWALSAGDLRAVG